MFLARRQNLVMILKASVFIFIFSIYFIVLVRESMNVMSNNAKSKTVSKVDNVSMLQIHPELILKLFLNPQVKENHANHQRNEMKHKQSTEHFPKIIKRKPPVSYLKPNPKYHPNVVEQPKSSHNESSKSDLDNESPSNSIYEYSEEINAQAERDFKKRKEHLWEVCEKNKIVGKLTPNAWEFFISPGHGIAWCNVFKAASTTWMYYMNILAGYDLKYLQRTVTTPLELARKRFPRPTLEDLYESLETSISFLIVREPFERLLSAYRNKMEEGKNTYYKLLGDQIVKRFRLQPPLKNVSRLCHLSKESFRSTLKI